MVHEETLFFDFYQGLLCAGSPIIPLACDLVRTLKIAHALTQIIKACTHGLLHFFSSSRLEISHKSTNPITHERYPQFNINKDDSKNKSFACTVPSLEETDS